MNLNKRGAVEKPTPHLKNAKVKPLPKKTRKKVARNSDWPKKVERLSEPMVRGRGNGGVVGGKAMCENRTATRPKELLWENRGKYVQYGF